MYIHVHTVLLCMPLLHCSVTFFVSLCTHRPHYQSIFVLFLTPLVSPLSLSASLLSINDEWEKERGGDKLCAKDTKNGIRQSEMDRERQRERGSKCVDYINGCSSEWKAWRRSLLPPRLCLLALATLQTARLDIVFNNIWSCFFAYSLFAMLPPTITGSPSAASFFLLPSHPHIHTNS